MGGITLAGNSPRSVKSIALRNLRHYDFIIQSGMVDPPYAPGETIGPLIRAFSVVCYCMHGKGVLSVNGNSYSIQRGQCYVALPGDIVTQAADEREPWQICWLLFDGTRTGVTFKSVGITSENPLFPWSSNPAILRKMLKIITYCQDRSQETEHRRIAYAHLFIDALLSYLGQADMAGPAKSIEEKYINDAIYYMECNCSQKLKISEIASHIGLNRSYFYSIFKDYTKLSPLEYLTRLRMQKACELFAFPNSTVTGVANSLGYEVSAFFRHFKEIIGMSPSEYKKRALQGACELSQSAKYISIHER